MAKGINLLPEIALAEEKELRVKKLLTLVSISVLLIGAIAVIVTFSIYIFLQKQLDNLVLVNNNLREDITGFVPLELKQRAVKSKIVAIKNIRSGSNNFDQYLSSLISMAGDGISLTSISIVESLSIQLAGTASSSDTVKTFLSNLLADQANKDGLFKDVTLGSISQSQNGDFQFTITMSAKGGSVTKPVASPGM